MKRLVLALAATGLATFATLGQAQGTWPEKPIKVVVPFGPGGTSDLLGRLMQKAIEDNKLLPQPVAIVNEVEFIDDSKGTNVGATLAAIQGLGVDRPLWLILGGEGKGQDFAPLMPAVRQYVKGAALIGRDAPLIQEAIQASGALLHRADSLPAAVQWCASQARPGHVVMLSPACASFDMFKDYAHRAQIFVDTVRALALEQGSLS